MIILDECAVVSDLRVSDEVRVAIDWPRPDIVMTKQIQPFLCRLRL